MNEISEKRYEERIEINDQSLLYCSDGSGEIVDISMKGLSFRHLTGNNWPQGVFIIDLLLDNSILLIEKISCSLIYPNIVTPDNTSPYRHALKFCALSARQELQLQEFIANQRGHLSTLTMI